jgi:hypothetical protein
MTNKQMKERVTEREFFHSAAIVIHFTCEMMCTISMGLLVFQFLSYMSRNHSAVHHEAIES